MERNTATPGATESGFNHAVRGDSESPGSLMEKPGGERVEAEAGVFGIEATTAVWGKKGKWLVIAGLVPL